MRRRQVNNRNVTAPPPPPEEIDYTQVFGIRNQNNEDFLCSGLTESPLYTLGSDLVIEFDIVMSPRLYVENTLIYLSTGDVLKDTYVDVSASGEDVRFYFHCANGILIGSWMNNVNGDSINVKIQIVSSSVGYILVNDNNKTETIIGALDVSALGNLVDLRLFADHNRVINYNNQILKNLKFYRYSTSEIVHQYNFIYPNHSHNDMVGSLHLHTYNGASDVYHRQPSFPWCVMDNMYFNIDTQRPNDTYTYVLEYEFVNKIWPIAGLHAFGATTNWLTENLLIGQNSTVNNGGTYILAASDTSAGRNTSCRVNREVFRNVKIEGSRSLTGYHRAKLSIDNVEVLGYNAGELGDSTHPQMLTIGGHRTNTLYRFFYFNSFLKKVKYTNSAGRIIELEFRDDGFYHDQHSGDRYGNLNNVTGELADNGGGKFDVYSG